MIRTFADEKLSKISLEIRHLQNTIMCLRNGLEYGNHADSIRSIGEFNTAMPQERIQIRIVSPTYKNHRNHVRLDHPLCK